jgi:hypothetical protein
MGQAWIQVDLVLQTSDETFEMSQMLLFPVVMSDQALFAKSHPLHKPVPGFGGIGRGVNRSPQSASLRALSS